VHDGENSAGALSGFLVIWAVIVGLITATIVLIDPSSDSGATVWIVTAVMLFAGLKLTSFCVLGAWAEGARRRALAVAGAGIVCLYLVGHAMTFDDAGGSSNDAHGIAHGTPPTLSDPPPVFSED
jgi:hypothetical protein